MKRSIILKLVLIIVVIFSYVSVSEGAKLNEDFFKNIKPVHEAILDDTQELSIDHTFKEGRNLFEKLYKLKKAVKLKVVNIQGEITSF